MLKYFVSVLAVSGCLTFCALVMLPTRLTPLEIVENINISTWNIDSDTSVEEMVRGSFPGKTPDTPNTAVSQWQQIDQLAHTASLVQSKLLNFYQLQLTNLTANIKQQKEIIEKIQEIRLRTMRRHCVNPANKNAVRDNLPFLRHLIQHSGQHRFAYCEVGKVASSSWRGVLKKAFGDNSASRRSDGAFEPMKRIPKHDRHFKFFFVRHPFDRLISAYKSKFLSKTEYLENLAPTILRKYRDQSADSLAKQQRRVSFEQFIRYISDVPVNKPRDDFHWSPQTLLCQPCRTHFDFLGHYETLYEDATYVLDRIGILDKVQFTGTTTTVNRVQRSIERIKNMFTNVSKSDIDKLKLIYKHDFEMFEYDPIV